MRFLAQLLRRAADTGDMLRKTTLSLLAVMALSSAAAAGCAPLLNPAQAANAASAEWVAGPVDLRAMTAIVRAKPAEPIQRRLIDLATRTGDVDERAFLLGVSEGGFGTGFVMVHARAGKRRAFLVTNRHVVESADGVEVTFADGTTYKDCPIASLGDEIDLAIVALPDAALVKFPHGLAPSPRGAKDRDVVVATGYPAVAGKPSFQTTEGKVSNASLDAVEVARGMIQHTAAIDPGSSGGPLTNEAGALVGVNTALVRDRQAMNLAVPAEHVAAAVRRAHEILDAGDDAPARDGSLVKACDALRTVATKSDTNADDLSRVAYALSNTYVGDEGWSSFVTFTPSQSSLRAFYKSPVAMMRVSVAVGLVSTAQRAELRGACAVVPGATRASARTRIDGAGEPYVIEWAFEQGAWRVRSVPAIEQAIVVAAAEAKLQAIVRGGQEGESKAPAKAGSKAPKGGSKAPSKAASKGAPTFTGVR